MYYRKLIVLLSFLSSSIYAVESSIPAIGNFALPPSLQPGLLFGFGQSIINQNNLVAFDNLSVRRFQKNHLLLNEVGLVYGLTDNCSIQPSIYLPVDFKMNKMKSTGVGDVLIQGEYALIQKEYKESVTLATIVGAISLPTGSSRKDPPTGFGSTAYFIGGTLYTISIDWYFFASVGNFFVTKHNHSKFGDIFYYQGGIGRNLKHMKDRILVLFLEFDGYKLNRDITCNRIVPNTGSNTIYLGPTLFYGAPKWSCGIGMQAPIFEKFCGKQPKSSWFFGFRFNWLLHHEPGDNIPGD